MTKSVNICVAKHLFYPRTNDNRTRITPISKLNADDDGFKIIVYEN